MRRQDLRELPAVGRYCNPTATQVLPEVLLPAEIPWLVSIIALASDSWGLVPLVGVLARRWTSQGHWTPSFTQIPLRQGRSPGRWGQGETLQCSESAPKSHHGHQCCVASWALWGPLGTPESLCHLDPRHACTQGTPAFGASLEKAGYGRCHTLASAWRLISNQLESFLAAPGMQALAIKPRTLEGQLRSGFAQQETQSVSQ